MKTKLLLLLILILPLTSRPYSDDPLLVNEEVIESLAHQSVRNTFGHHKKCTFHCCGHGIHTYAITNCTLNLGESSKSKNPWVELSLPFIFRISFSTCNPHLWMSQLPVEKVYPGKISGNYRL